MKNRAGQTIKALVRDPASSKAKLLASQGVELVKGDLDDVASLNEALRGVTAAYLVTPADLQQYDHEKEISQFSFLP